MARGQILWRKINRKSENINKDANEGDLADTEIKNEHLKLICLKSSHSTIDWRVKKGNMSEHASK